MKSEVSINGNRLQVTRVFNAPRELVFGFWTTAEKYRQWSRCKECVECEVAMDFRVGGAFTQTMQLALHGEMHQFTVTGAYDEIVEPERIRYSANFGPFTARVTVEFFEQGQDTKVVVTHEGLPDEFFVRNVAQGTSESFDKLEHLLASQAMPASQTTPASPAVVAQ